jgi:hypothetical protein
VAYVDTPTTPAQNQRFVLRVHMDSPCTDTGSTRNNLDVLIYYVTDVGGTFHREIFPDSEDFVCSGKSYVIAPDNQAGPSEVANMTISN